MGCPNCLKLVGENKDLKVRLRDSERNLSRYGDRIVALSGRLRERRKGEPKETSKATQNNETGEVLRFGFSPEHEDRFLRLQEFMNRRIAAKQKQNG